MTTFSLSNRDAVAWLERLPAGSVHLAITDPPYESLEKHRAVGTTTRLKHSKASSNDWFAIFPNERFDELFTQLYRVLAKNSHLYLFCDPETMFVAKPAGERAGFKFWKPLIWDKCLGPDTLVWTERGVVRIDEVHAGDRVALPEGGSTTVIATRRTRAPSLRLRLSDGTTLVASRDHRFVRGDAVQVAARELQVGDALCVRNVRLAGIAALELPTATLALDHPLGKIVGRHAKDRGGEMDPDVVRQFVGGVRAHEKHLKPAVFAAREDFRRGVLDGLLDGDGASSDDTSRRRYTGASPDLASFVLRELSVRGCRPELRRCERDGAAVWEVEYDPISCGSRLTVTAIEEVGEQELVDIAVEDRDELFLLANGVVTHNCRIGMGYHYRARYECVLFFEKGKRKLSNLGLADIIQAPRVIDGYPAEKPVAVSEVLVQQSSVAGELVIDPFMGSGSAGVAAARHARNFAGNDLCREAVEITERRLLEAGATRVAEDEPVAIGAGAGQTELMLG